LYWSTSSKNSKNKILYFLEKIKKASIKIRLTNSSLQEKILIAFVALIFIPTLVVPFSIYNKYLAKNQMASVL